MKPGMPVMRSTRLLAQVRERIRYLNYSLSPAKAYLYWVRFHPLNRGLGGNPPNLSPATPCKPYADAASHAAQV